MENKNCYRCGAKAQFNYKSGLIVCSTCFNDQICMRKFRSFLRNTLDVFGKTNNLICAFDGSVNSAMLVHLFAQNTDHTDKMKKRMFLQGEAVYVDFSSLFSYITFKSATNTDNVIEEMKELDINELKDSNRETFIRYMEHINCPYKVLPIQQYFDIHKLAKEIQNIPLIGGYREDYLSIIKLSTIKTYMIDNNYKKTIFSDNAQQLATRSLKLMCKSRTNEITQECAELCTEVYQGHEIIIGRPLAEINDREVLYYLRVNKLFDYTFDDMVGIKVDSNLKMNSLPGNGNMNTLLADFVRNLQVIL